MCSLSSCLTDEGKKNFLRAKPLFQDNDINTFFYNQMTKNILDLIIPSSMKLIDDKENCLTEFRKLLPFVSYDGLLKDERTIEAPFNLSFYLICSFRPSAFQFFFELITRWLIPGKRLNVELFFAADFQFPNLSDDIYTLVEVKVKVESPSDLVILQEHLPIIETELRLGLESVYHARRILELKGMNIDSKTALIHDRLASLIKRKSENVNWDILSEMQQFIVTSSDKFKLQRTHKHMSRLICFLYLFRRELKKTIKQENHKRLVYVRLLHTKIRSGDRPKNVLGVLVGLNFLQDHEIFEEKHLMKGITNVIAGIEQVEGSFFTHIIAKEPYKLLYVEIEKKGETFSKEETALLRKMLPFELKDRIERLLHPIFMPRNEEEIMRNIVTLSNQIKFVRDIPEVILSFEEHTATKLSFTVILVRVLKNESKSVFELFESSNTFLEYSFERTKIVGVLRQKYPKEASVFHVKVDKSLFVREDHSIDLYKARQIIVSELTKIFGDLRDFNGGMITKQNELLLDLKELLGGVARHHELLLENFFYSLTPVVMRSLLDPAILKKMFIFMLDAIEDSYTSDTSYFLQLWQEIEGIYVLLLIKDNGLHKEVIKAVEELRSLGIESAYVNVVVQDKRALGFIYKGCEPEKQAQYFETIEEVVKSW